MISRPQTLGNSACAHTSAHSLSPAHVHDKDYECVPLLHCHTIAGASKQTQSHKSHAGSTPELRQRRSASENARNHSTMVTIQEFCNFVASKRCDTNSLQLNQHQMSASSGHQYDQWHLPSAKSAALCHRCELS